MADLAWTAWLDEVWPWASKAPKQFVLNAVREAAIVLCEKGKVFTLASDLTDLAVNTPEYAWANTTYTNVEPAEIWQVFYNDNPLELLGRGKLKTHFVNFTTQSGGPYVATRVRPGAIRLIPTPTVIEVDALEIWAFVRPKRAATGILDEIGYEYFRQIGNGAKARLMQTPNTPYYNQPLGADYHKRFDRDIADAAMKAELGGMDVDLEGEGEFY